MFDAKNDIPGPGNYEYVIEGTIAAEGKKIEKTKMVSDSDRPMTQSVFFKSTTERFAKIDAINPNIHIIEVNGKGRKTVSQGKGPGSE